ncbi:MAG: GDP-mannose 4,6-dehydratase [Jatrophihabitans sp.]
MRALITGVTGQDGWYLSELLLDGGAEVFGLVSSGDPGECPPGVAPVVGDLRDAASLVAAVQTAAPDEVYDLASISSVAASWADPVGTADVNGMGTARLLAAIDTVAGSNGGPRLVHASSAEIFGDAAPPQDEKTPIAPVTPYGAAKAFAHHCVAVHRGAGHFSANAILFNHESPRRPDTFVTRKITRQVARIAHGDTAPLELGNLAARRDWGFAGDYVRALIAIARTDEPADFVIATGHSHSVQDFVRVAFAHVGIEDWRAHVRADAAATRRVEAREQRGNAARAAHVLGWTPTTTFEQLVADMVDTDLSRTTEWSTQ